MAANLYGVPRKQWEKWPTLARKVFNKHFREIKLNKEILGHPQMADISKRMWHTLAWNCAWLAADSVKEGLKEMSKGDFK